VLVKHLIEDTGWRSGEPSPETNARLSVATLGLQILSMQLQTDGENYEENAGKFVFEGGLRGLLLLVVAVVMLISGDRCCFVVVLLLLKVVVFVVVIDVVFAKVVVVIFVVVGGVVVVVVLVVAICYYLSVFSFNGDTSHKCAI